jgi:WD40 repeat protein
VREDELLEQATLKGHAFWVTSLAFAPDGQALVSAGCAPERESFGRCNVVMWDADGRKLREWAFPGVVCGVAFAPDGRHLATANSNGTVYVLRLAGR